RLSEPDDQDPVTPAAAEPERVPAPSEAVQPPTQLEEMSVVKSYEQRAHLAEDRLTEVLDAYRALKAETEGHRERIAKNLERRYLLNGRGARPARVIVGQYTAPPPEPAEEPAGGGEAPGPVEATDAAPAAAAGDPGSAASTPAESTPAPAPPDEDEPA